MDKEKLERVLSKIKEAFDEEVHTEPYYFLDSWCVAGEKDFLSRVEEILKEEESS